MTLRSGATRRQALSLLAAAPLALPRLLTGGARPTRAQGVASAAPSNVILVAFDTTRADHLGCYGYHRNTSPNLDRFAREAVLFERCYSQSNETLTSFASLLSSSLPSEIAPPSYETFFIPPDAESLQAVLKIYGYRTAAFVAGGHLVHAFGHDQGFDVYEDRWHFGSFFHTMPPALRWLDQRDGDSPFFLFVQGYDAHGPYAKPLYFEHIFDQDYQGIADRILRWDQPLEVEKIWNGRYYPEVSDDHVRRRLGRRRVQVLHTDLFSLLALQDPRGGLPITARDLQHITAHYDGSIVYADLQFGLFLRQLRKRELLEDSIIIVLGDHGEDLMEHGHVNHRISLHDASSHVPLLIRFPGGAHAGRRVSQPVQLLDVVPTVLDQLSAVIPSRARGRSLMPLLDGTGDAARPLHAVSEGILPMGSVRGPDHRLVISGLMPGSEAFLQLVRGADPTYEGLSLFALAPGSERRLPLDNKAARQVARRLLEGLAEAYRDHVSPRGERLPYIDPALMEIMRDKGYW